MGHRTLSLALVFRALFLDAEAFDEMREDDNPFVEGLFLVVLIGLVSALLALVGRLLAWASTPSVAAIQQVVLDSLEQQAWWDQMAANPAALDLFTRLYNLAWQVFPALAGMPDPSFAALQIVIWPAVALLSWLIYGLLAHGFSRLLGGAGTLSQTLGDVALSFTPLLLRGLGIVPFFVVGAAINTWQLILRYKALRVAHQLPWGRALAATLLPFAVYLLLWVGLAIAGALVLGAFLSVASTATFGVD